jgi:DNA mismatch repair protein MutL
LIPRTINLSPDDAQLFQEWSGYFNELGFEIDTFGNDSFIVHAVPANLETGDLKGLIESVLETLKTPGQDYKADHNRFLAKTIAKRMSIKRGRKLHQEEIDTLIENLFACEAPGISPDGKPTMMVISFDELFAKFKI